MTEKEELQEVKTEAWPGYKLGFGIVSALLTVYLLIILFSASHGLFYEGAHH